MGVLKNLPKSSEAWCWGMAFELNSIRFNDALQSPRRWRMYLLAPGIFNCRGLRKPATCTPKAWKNNVPSRINSKRGGSVQHNLGCHWGRSRLSLVSAQKSFTGAHLGKFEWRLLNNETYQKIKINCTFGLDLSLGFWVRKLLKKRFLTSPP